jgi:hypothetical protein
MAVVWPATPAAADYTGIELMPKDVARAEASIGHLQPPPRFSAPTCARPPCRRATWSSSSTCCTTSTSRHRKACCARARCAGAGGNGRLLLRVGDASSRRGFAISQWVDRTVTRIRGHKVSPTWGRPLAEWTALLQRMGFRVQAFR